MSRHSQLQSCKVSGSISIDQYPLVLNLQKSWELISVMQNQAIELSSSYIILRANNGDLAGFHHITFVSFGDLFL